MIISAEKKEKKLAAISMVQDITGNVGLIKELAKNDFKKKFAGSYFGILWAFVSPIVTIFVYWFVFTVGMRGAANDVDGYPFVLWLIAGIVPWFLFSEIMTSGTNVLIEYTYLVKKIVFNISILPVMKIVTATVIHLFFVLLMIIIFACTGHFPSIYMLQIPYYMMALWVLSAACVFMTSAIVVFFKDLTQVVNIFLQVFIWITPIMWQDAAMLVDHPVIARIIRLNPMYYIVNGYRDAMIHHVWFWEKPGMTIYFWIVTLLLFVFGTSLFTRLKPHFADVI
ncbi:MAG: ABC transporter permease [Thermoflexaceae bacterium]|nr:ABC transporter permease [Thermoflexaceae bacterium]